MTLLKASAIAFGCALYVFSANAEAQPTPNTLEAHTQAIPEGPPSLARALATQWASAQRLPPASFDRTTAIDQSYLDACALINQLLNARDQAVLDGQDTAADDMSRQLSMSRTIRREARQLASEAALAKIQNTQLQNIQTEILAIPLDLQFSWRKTQHAWLKAPKDVNQIQALGGLFLGLMELALFLFFFIWVHGRAPYWVRRLLDELESGKDGGTWDSGTQFPAWMVAGDIGTLAAPLGRATQSLIKVLGAAMVFRWLAEPAPLLAWIALIPALTASVRLAWSFTGLALIGPSQTRPALYVTDPKTRQAVLWVINVFGNLIAINIISVHLLESILDAHHSSLIVSNFIGVVSILALGLGMHKWGDTLRTRIAEGGAETAIARWIAGINRPASSLMNIARAATAIVLLSVRLLIALLNGLIESRAGLSWLGAALARRQLRDNPKAPRAPLGIGTRKAIGAGALQFLNRDETIAEIVQLHATWTTDPRRGMVALTGDRGAGKTVLLAQLGEHLGNATTQSTVPAGHTTKTAALNWLIQTANITASPNTESVIEALQVKPSHVFLISDLHRLFLRTVGHYHGLDAVLDVMQATAKRHFWVASLHEPAWTFLASMEQVGNVGVFSHKVHLGPTGPADMSAWLHARTRAAGFKASFEAMTQRQSTGTNRARLLERAERAYWRLMVEASQGNPTVAAKLWLDGLQPCATEGVLLVGVPRAHDSTELEQLTDGELFSLTAITLHEDISVPELSIVLNIPQPRVRAACRGLEQLTLITETNSGRYKIRLNWLPAVERHLRRRSFLHKG
jgi:hypothetical protein